MTHRHYCHLIPLTLLSHSYWRHHPVVQRMKHVASWASLLAFNVSLKSSARWDRLAELHNKSVKYKSNVAHAEPSTLRTMSLFAAAKPFVSRMVALHHLQEKQKKKKTCVSLLMCVRLALLDAAQCAGTTKQLESLVRWESGTDERVPPNCTRHQLSIL